MRILIAWKLGALAMVGVASSWGWLASRSGAPPAALRTGATPVVVELFSSEGCSSCPPADAYLAALDRAQSVDGVAVVALEEHVDYWDYIGWKDPFAQPQFGERQHRYASALSETHVYTPEVVIDGRFVMSGGDEDGARAMMQRSAAEPRARVVLARHGANVLVDVANAPASAAGDAPEAWLAITESGLSTNVARGENKGRTLAHAPVVRALRKLGAVTSPSFHAEPAIDADPSWKPQALRVVVFVQLAKSRRIVGAAAI